MAPTNRRRKRRKPAKPYPSFPLTAHNNGQWCKKIRGKVHFFGVWAEPKQALESYLLVAKDLHAGLQPQDSRVTSEGPSVKTICNQYLNHQLRKLESGELSYRTFDDYRRAAKSFADFVGHSLPVDELRPEVFARYRLKLVKHGLTGGNNGLGVHALLRTVTMIKSIMKYAFETDLIDRPIKYGSSFEGPSASVRRKTRRAQELQNGKRLFQAAEIQAMLRAAEAPLRAMILLGINGGFGNTDCAWLPVEAVDLEGAVIRFDRPKTGVERIVPLWAETVEALREVLDKRPKATDEEGGKLVFLTSMGRPWLRNKVHKAEGGGVEKVIVIDHIRGRFDKVLVSLNLKRKGLGFYALRHTFRTWADEVKDQHAIYRIMGHSIPGMSGVYVEEISLERMRAVVDHVHDKLFAADVKSSVEAGSADSSPT